jgi:streptogramin lyase
MNARRTSARGAEMIPIVIAAVALMALGVQPAAATEVTYFEVPRGAHPHDVAPAPDGNIWYTAQSQGALGVLNPKSGQASQISLGNGAAPHGVIVGPDRAAWITDGGQNANVRLDTRVQSREAFSAAGRISRRQSQHRDLRPQRYSLVYGSERRLRPCRSVQRKS